MKVKIWNLLKRIIPIIPIWQAFQVLFTQLGEVFKLKSSFWDINTFAILYTAQFFMFQTVYKKLVNNYVDKILPNFDHLDCIIVVNLHSPELGPLNHPPLVVHVVIECPQSLHESLEIKLNLLRTCKCFDIQKELFREKLYIIWIDIQKVETIFWLISFS